MNSNLNTQQIIKLYAVDSTNNYAMNLLKEGWNQNLACIWAMDQTKGRGQHGNAWLSEPGKNLTCSFIYFPDGLEAQQNFFISMTASIAAIEFLERYCSSAFIKWPNDLYLGNKKAGGILIENILEKQWVRSSVLGLGININQKEFLPELNNPTSICLCAGKELDLDECMGILYQLVAKNLQLLTSHEYAEIKLAYLGKLLGYQKRMPYQDRRGTFYGTLTNIGESGEIQLTDDSGLIRKYMFREVEMLI